MTTDGNKRTLAAAAPAKPARMTVDLDRPQHRQLKPWTLHAGTNLGVHVTQAECAMITLLVERPDLAGVVTHLLHQQRSVDD